MSNHAGRSLSASIRQDRWAVLTSNALKPLLSALMRIALADNRRCFIMLFSSEVVHYELTIPQGA